MFLGDIMQLSTKGRYGILVMLYLANNYKQDRFITLKEISESENISLKYLEKIMLNFKDTDYFITTRGASGGYKLAYSPSYYKIKDILMKAEGNLDVVPCLDSFNCHKKTSCSSIKLWKDLNDAVNSFLDTKTLSDYINEVNYEKNTRDK